jgi:hypothetical protein
MAITFNTNQLDGMVGTTVNGVYCRIQTARVKKYDATTNPNVAAHWDIFCDVILHQNASARNAAGESPEWPNRLRSRRIDAFVFTYDPASNSNPYAQAYVALKTQLANDSLASSIADA